MCWTFLFYFLVFYWGKTLGYLWSLRSLVTGWAKWPKFRPSRPEFLEFFSLQNPTPLRGFGEKKGPFINKPWSKNSCTGWNKKLKFWPSPTEFLGKQTFSKTKPFFLQNPTPLRGFGEKSLPPPSQSKTNACDIIFSNLIDHR